MRFLVRIFLLFFVLFFADSSAASILKNEACSKVEMAECFVLMLKESFNKQSMDTYNDLDTNGRGAVVKEIEISEKESCDVSAMCSYCGSKYALWTGWHYPDCVCPYYGGKRGLHINCNSTDWKGFEDHDFQTVIEKTTLAINKNSNNKDAYFNRGVAYFELGNFDEAVNDYYFSNKGLHQPKSFYKASKEFVVALLREIQSGSAEAAIEFVPSLCSSTYGMGKTLWACVQCPVDSFTHLANACYEVGQHTFEYCKEIDWDTIEGYSEHVKTVCQKFNQLSETEKGELIGYALGKYGVDFLANATLGVGVYKDYNIVRNLKNANRVCNLEVMAVSTANKQAIIQAAKEHALSRNSYFKSVKYNYDDHFKHIANHHYYDGKRSIWNHPDPEGLLKRFDGKGQPKAGTIGLPGYKENVDFGEYIGVWKENKVGGQALPTTKGTIHYSKKGAHIVPACPTSQIKTSMKRD